MTDRHCHDRGSQFVCEILCIYSEIIDQYFGIAPFCVPFICGHCLCEVKLVDMPVLVDPYVTLHETDHITYQLHTPSRTQLGRPILPQE
jgi:hypothetical protein